MIQMLRSAFSSDRESARQTESNHGRKAIIQSVAGTPSDPQKGQKSRSQSSIPKANPKINPEAMPTSLGKRLAHGHGYGKEKIKINPAKVSQTKTRCRC